MQLKISANYIGLTIRIHANGSLIFEQRGDNLDGSVLPQQFEMGEQVRLNPPTEPVAVIQSTDITMTEQPSLSFSAPDTIHKRYYTVELLALKGRTLHISEEKLLGCNARSIFQFEFDEKPTQDTPVSVTG